MPVENGQSMEEKGRIIPELSLELEKLYRESMEKQEEQYEAINEIYLDRKQNLGKLSDPKENMQNPRRG